MKLVYKSFVVCSSYEEESKQLRDSVTITGICRK